MTREETKKHFESWCQGHIGNTASNEDCHMFNNIMALLEQEHCKDAISVTSVFEIMGNLLSIPYDFNRSITEKDVSESMDKIRELPRVTPREPRKGHWIEHEWEEMREKGYYRCSVCNHGYQRYTKGIRKSDVPYIDRQEYKLWNYDNYCPNCGADMKEVYNGNVNN